MDDEMMRVLTSGLSPAERDHLLATCERENARQVQVAVDTPGRHARPRARRPRQAVVSDYQRVTVDP